METTETLLMCAEAFARKRHVGQHRNNKVGDSKIDHLTEVASLVQRVGGSDDAIAAAWLHDILEGTQTTREEILERFGERVCRLVEALTDDAELTLIPNILERKSLQAKKFENVDAIVHLVKVADQLSNIRSVKEDPPVDWDTLNCMQYMEGAMLVVMACKKAPVELLRQFQEEFRVTNAQILWRDAIYD